MNGENGPGVHLRNGDVNEIVNLDLVPNYILELLKTGFIREKWLNIA